ncbi:MAG: SDR family NAD(P)-dependent oxidoreductase [Microbacterium sp.]
MAVLDTFSLAGKTALVTGGNRGLGLAFARGLAEAGARVVIASRDAERNRAAVDTLRGEGIEVGAIDVDITQPGEADRMVAEAVEHLGGRLDIVLNNAGLSIHRPALEVTDEEWDAVVNLNLTALWKVSIAAARVMKEQGGGNIVNTGSISSLIVNRPQWQPAYNASKAGVHQLTKSLAAEWAEYGIRVNAVAPGYVKTDMAPVDEPHFRQHWIEDAPMKRYATPEEIAPTIVYLASDASAFMTGSVVVIDGGYTLY